MPALLHICGCMIRVAALLAPPQGRGVWAEQWLAEVWHGFADLTCRGASRAEIRRKLLRFSTGAFRDAADIGWRAFDLHSVSRHRALPLAVPLALLGVSFLMTHAFRHCREVMAGVNAPHAEQLLLLSRSARVLGMESAPSLRDLHAWQRKANGASLAGFVIDGSKLQVTPEFYGVLGRAPRVPFQFLGHRIEKVGKLPLSFERLGVLARLNPSTPVDGLEQQLARISSPNGCAVAAASLEGRTREPLVFASLFFALMLLLGGIFARPPRLLFLTSTALAQFTIAASWAELAARLPLSPTGAISASASLLIPGLLLVSSLALRWSVRDHQERCPECGSRLASPVRIGSRSSIVLDRAGIEALCPAGHGSLFVPEPVIDTAEPALWTAFHESWKGC